MVEAHGLSQTFVPAEMALPFQVTEKRVEGGGAGTLMLPMLLPYVLALSAFVGGLYAANDLVAGEKESVLLKA